MALRVALKAGYGVFVFRRGTLFLSLVLLSAANALGGVQRSCGVHDRAHKLGERSRKIGVVGVGLVDGRQHLIGAIQWLVASKPAAIAPTCALSHAVEFVLRSR